jgi:hypothetical protein
MAEKIDKKIELDKLQAEVEAIKKELGQKQTEQEIEEMPTFNVPNFELFSKSNKLNVIYNEVVYVRDNLKLLFEKVKEIQSAVGKPS